MSYEKIVFINFRSAAVRYLPMYELLLASAIKEAGLAQEVKIYTLFNEKELFSYIEEWKGVDIFIFWEYFSTKAPSYIYQYFKNAALLKEKLGKPIYFGGFWATSYGRYFEEFQVFDKIFEGYSIDGLVGALSHEEKLKERFIDIKGDANFDKYPLNLSYLATPEKYIVNKCLMGYLTSFGCPRNCKFCFANSARNVGSGFSTRSIRTVKKDLDELNRFFNFKTIVIKDLNFFYDTRRAFAILNYLGKEKSVTANLDVTIDKLDPGFFRELKQYNIQCELYFGLESFDPVYRKRVGKPFPHDKLQEVFELAEKNKTHLSGNIILGFPWQTPESLRQEIKKAIDYINRYQHVFIYMNVYKPEYGTDIQKEFFARVHEKITFKELVDIYLNKISRLQKRIYGEAFKKVNIEFIFNTMLLINYIKTFALTAAGKKKKILEYFRARLQDNILKNQLPGPFTRLLLSRKMVYFLILAVLPHLGGNPS